MKKMYLFALTLLCGVLFLTACGGSSNKMTCSGDMKEGDQKVGSAEIVAEFDDDDKVKNASISIEFEDADTASQMYAFMQLGISFAKAQAEEEGKDFPDIKMNLDGKKLTIDDYASFASMSADEEDGEPNIIGMTRDEFKKYIEENNDDGVFTCK